MMLNRVEFAATRASLVSVKYSLFCHSENKIKNSPIIEGAFAEIALFCLVMRLSPSYFRIGNMYI